MKTLNQEYEAVGLDQLKLHPRNPNHGDVGAIYTSIETNGFYGAVIAQKSTGYILAGNHRYLAAREAHAAEVPVIWVDVDDTQALKILLADNRHAELGTRDSHVLAELLAELANSDPMGGLLGTGYDGDDLDQILEDMGAAAPEPEPPAEKTKDGEAALHSTFAVYVDCQNETMQVDLLKRLTEEGFECRALTS